MADMFLNLELSGGGAGGRGGGAGGRGGGGAERGNRRHRQFVKRRKFLERRGFLKQKQLPPKPANKKPGQHSGSWDHSKSEAQRGDRAHHPQGTPDTDVHQQGASCGSGETLSVTVDPDHARVATFTSNHAPAKGHRPAHQGPINGHVLGAKDQSRPSLQPPSSALLSEFSSGLPSPTPSYKLVAIDCEMVGTGPKGSVSALARCSVVSYHGDVVYDKYIKPANPVTDYRTRWSGIRREHLVNAVPFAAAQKEILKILQGKTVIGHAIQNDYKALGYFHPKEMTRDTSRIALLNRRAGFPEHEMASLKRLAKQLLHKDIQTGRGGHSSVEDAKTTMELYRVVEAEYERELASA